MDEPLIGRRVRGPIEAIHETGCLQQMTDLANGDELESEDDLKTLKSLSDDFRRVQEQIGRVVIGQEDVIHELFVTLLGDGHALLVGVPGLAKTLLIRTLAQSQIGRAHV